MVPKTKVSNGQEEDLINSNRGTLPRRMRFEFLDLKATLILILAYLRPEDVMQHNRADHHITDEKVHQDQYDGHHAADYLNGLAGKGFSDGKGGSDQGGVREDEREPSH